jgi:hypothetical protein
MFNHVPIKYKPMSFVSNGGKFKFCTGSKWFSFFIAYSAQVFIWTHESIVVPCEQQLLIELAINSGDFYVMFQRENHFINKRIQKPRRLNMKCIPAVNSVKKTNRNRYNSQSWKFHVTFFIANWNSYCCSPCIICFTTCWIMLAETKKSLE